MTDVFSSTWVEGKIVNIDKFLDLNKDREFLIFIDTNFAIYAREFVTQRETFMINNPDIARTFQNAVETINNLDSVIVYHFACEEASRSKANGNIDLMKYELMVNCVSKVFNRKLSSQLRSINTLLNEKITHSKVPLLKCNGLFKNVAPITYVSILKAFLIKHFDGNLDNKGKVLKYIQFLNNELNIYTPIMITFGIHYFGKEPNILKNVKPKNGVEKILNKIYAASIDLMMPTIVAQTSEYMNGNVAPLFLTFDKGIKLLFDSLSVVKYENISDNQHLPVYSYAVFYSSGWNKEDILEFGRLSQEISSKRLKDGVKPDFNYYRILLLCAELEKELTSRITQV